MLVFRSGQEINKHGEIKMSVQNLSIPSLSQFRLAEKMYGLTPYDPVSTIETHAYQIDSEVFPLPSCSEWRYVPVCATKGNQKSSKKSSKKPNADRKPSAISFRVVAKIVTPWHVIPDSHKLAIKKVANALHGNFYGHPEACPWEEMREQYGLTGSVYDKATTHVVIQARLFGANLPYWPERSGQFLSKYNGAIFPEYFDPSFQGNMPRWVRELKTIEYYGKIVLDWSQKYENWQIIRQNTVDCWH
jgi:hypothetical protein